MTIGYFIMLHQRLGQFERLLRAIYHPDNDYVVHVDLKAGTDLCTQVRRIAANYANVTVLPAQAAQWSGYSLVAITLDAIKVLLQQGRNWDHFINLSGQDFPLLPQSVIIEQLNGYPQTSFIHVRDQLSDWTDALPRLQYIYQETDHGVVNTGVQREFLTGCHPYGGSQWLVLNRTACEYMTNDNYSGLYQQFYRNTQYADEGFFQTVIMNSVLRDQVINDNRRFMIWANHAAHPQILRAWDYQCLIQSGCWFARKFDDQVDQTILTMLEQNLQGRLVNSSAVVAKRVLQWCQG